MTAPTSRSRRAAGAFVSPVTRYLCLCHYGGVWQPLAVAAGGEVVGFVMWAVDPETTAAGSAAWSSAASTSGKGYGRAAVLALLERLRREQGCTSAALSYAAGERGRPGALRVTRLRETGEREDDELVARLIRRELTPAPTFSSPALWVYSRVRVRT